MHDDFVRDPRAVYLETLKFLGVDDDGQVKFKRTRETTSFKSAWLHSPHVEEVFADDLSMRRKMKEILRSAMAVESELDEEVRKRIKKYNAADSKPRQIMTEDTRAMLREYFAPDVALLGELLSRDLSEWQ